MDWKRVTAWLSVTVVWAPLAVASPRELAQAEGSSPAPVRATEASELWPAASTSFHAWAQNSNARPDHFDVFVEPDGGARFRVNREDRHSITGGIDGTRLIYRQVHSGQSDLRLYDLASRQHLSLPDQVNTKAKEWGPTMSGGRILFGRVERVRPEVKRSKIYLFDLATQDFKMLADTFTPRVLVPGQINGDWATWSRCGRRSCSMVRYRISDGTRFSVPSAGPAYATSIDESGTAYFASSDPGVCGKDVGLYRFPLGGPATLVATVPRGRDILSTYAYSGSDGGTRLQFARVDCPEPGGTFRGDIFRLDPAAVTAPPDPGTDIATGVGTVTYQVNVAHSGRLDDATLAPPLRKLWTVDLGNQMSYPLVADGKIFVNVRNDEAYGGTLYALDAGTGQQIWFQNTGGTYYWTNSAFDAGRVFTVDGDGTMTAFDADDGTQLWTKQMPGQYSFSSSPTASDGMVYTAGAGSGGTVYAVRQSDGVVDWTASVANGDHSPPTLSATRLFVGYSCPNVYSLDRATGDEIWRYSTGCSGGGGKTTVLHDGYLYARDYDGVYVFRADDGELVDKLSGDRAPAFAGTTGYFLSGGNLEARTVPAGSTEWRFATQDDLTMAPVIANGHVYLGSSSGIVYALDRATGSVVWRSDVGGAILPPDEHNVSQPLTGLGLGRGILLVPHGSKLTAFVNRS